MYLSGKPAFPFLDSKEGPSSGKVNEIPGSLVYAHGTCLLPPGSWLLKKSFLWVVSCSPELLFLAIGEQPQLHAGENVC